MNSYAGLIQVGDPGTPPLVTLFTCEAAEMAARLDDYEVVMVKHSSEDYGEFLQRVTSVSDFMAE